MFAYKKKLGKKTTHTTKAKTKRQKTYFGIIIVVFNK